MPQGDSNRTSLVKALERAEDVLSEGRERVKDLRAEDEPPDSLEKLLTDYGIELSHPDIEFAVRVLGAPQKLHPVVRETVEHIGREAISNAFRHSAASKVAVEIIFGSVNFQLLIQDNGIGIGKNICAHGKAGHWGLQGMREQAEEIGGKVRIENRPESGVEIELIVPSTIAYMSSSESGRIGWFGRKRRAVGYEQ
jgi:signal transduction histidine kinase